MKVRSNYHGYTEAVDRFFNKLIPMVTDLQVTTFIIRASTQESPML